MVEKWECDGCGKVIETDHIEREPVCNCPNFMGYMMVGGPAHTNFHKHGISPMKVLLEDIQNFMDEHPEEFFDFVGFGHTHH